MRLYEQQLLISDGSQAYRQRSLKHHSQSPRTPGCLPWGAGPRGGARILQGPATGSSTDEVDRVHLQRVPPGESGYSAGS